MRTGVTAAAPAVLGRLFWMWLLQKVSKDGLQFMYCMVQVTLLNLILDWGLVCRHYLFPHRVMSNLSIKKQWEHYYKQGARRYRKFVHFRQVFHMFPIFEIELFTIIGAPRLLCIFLICNLISLIYLPYYNFI